MIEKAKIALSAKELELVCNSEWILTKQAIIQKVYGLFGELAEDMRQLMLAQQEHLPAEVFVRDPKISKGENYNGLPYVMLDYPRYFEKDHVLAIRVFFWWGHFFSINLQLAGRCKAGCIPALIKHFEILQQHNYQLCVNDDPWQHHFETDNYRPLTTFAAGEFNAFLQGKPFIKIGKKISLNQWMDVPKFLEDSFIEILLLLKN